MSENKNSKIISIATGLIALSMLVWIIYLRNSKPDSNIVAPLVIMGVMLIVFIWASFWKSISEKLKLNNPNSSKKNLTREELNDIIEKIVEGTEEKEFKDGMYRNLKNIEDVRSGLKGEGIYAVLVRLSYPISNKDTEKDGFWIIVDVNNESNPSIIAEGISKEELENEMKLKSEKYKDPIIKEELAENETLGIKSTRKTITPVVETKEKEEEAL